MFTSLADRFQEVFKALSRRGKLRPADVDEALSEIRLALLEGDVHYSVVQSIVQRVRQRSLGEETSRSINPGQQVVRIMHEELVRQLGEPGRLSLSGPRPRTVMLVGLQGSGKTTTAAKLALWLRDRGERVWLVAADPYRPAAQEQLQILGSKIGVQVYSGAERTSEEACSLGAAAAAEAGASVIIIDTAGRSEIDPSLMEELSRIGPLVNPQETLLVADSMMGQQALAVAKGFHQGVGLTGIILTKLDGDARGGAALSMRAITGVSIKFLGVGEDLKDLELFDPGRIAGRILGMGDLQGLLEMATGELDVRHVEKQAARLVSGEFNLQDFRDQIQQVGRIGSLGKIMNMLPAGLVPKGLSLQDDQLDRSMRRNLAILDSMTGQERRSPQVLNGSRKRRIAAGSGTTVQEVNQLLKQFEQLRRVMKKSGKRGERGLSPFPF
jgi:signal recognition particle subunit SRP54